MWRIFARKYFGLLSHATKNKSTRPNSIAQSLFHNFMHSRERTRQQQILMLSLMLYSENDVFFIPTKESYASCKKEKKTLVLWPPFYFVSSLARPPRPLSFHFLPSLFPLGYWSDRARIVTWAYDCLSSLSLSHSSTSI